MLSPKRCRTSSEPPDQTATADRERVELFELYKIAIEEYHFQVNLNWSRTQYYLVLNVGIVAVATSVLQLTDQTLAFIAGGLYLAGLVCCILSLAAASVQQGYYQRTRQHKAAVESRLDLVPRV